MAKETRAPARGGRVICRPPAAAAPQGDGNQALRGAEGFRGDAKVALRVSVVRFTQADLK